MTRDLCFACCIVALMVSLPVSVKNLSDRIERQQAQISTLNSELQALDALIDGWYRRTDKPVRIRTEYFI